MKTMSLKPMMLALVAVMSFICLPTASANQIKKMATMDMQKIFDGYYKTKIMRDKFAKQQAVIAKENDGKLEKVKQIVDAIKTLEKQLKDPVLSPKRKEALAKKRKDFSIQGNALEGNRQQWLREKREAIRKEIKKEMDKIVAQIKEKMEAYSREKDFDLVLDSSAMSVTQTRILVYIDEKYDITQPILELLNKDAKKPAKATGDNK